MTQRPGAWLAAWGLTSTAGWILGFALGAIVKELLAPLDPDATLLQGIYAVLSIAAACILAGTAQSFLLPREWQMRSSWISATSAGTGVGVLILLFVGAGVFILSAAATFAGIGQTGGGDATGWVAATLLVFPFLAAILIGWIAFGLTISLFQSRLLHKRIGSAKWWKRSTMLAWGLGVPIAYAGVSIIRSLLPFALDLQYGNALVPFLLSGIYGGVVAVAIGITMSSYFTRTDARAVHQGGVTHG